MKQTTGCFASLLLIALLSLAGVGVFGWRWLHQPIATATALNYDVPRGASVLRIARELEAEGWISHPRWWSWWIRLTGNSAKLRAGEYELKSGMSPRQLAQLFTSGEVVLRSITIVEGSTFRELRRALAKRDDVEHTLKDQSDAAVVEMLDLPATHPEGWFFPDTYQYARNTRDLEILRMAQQSMQSELDEAWRQRAGDLPLQSPYELLILASIVEKETALASERPLIAGVFIERLARGMLLQTDPTIIYGLGDSYDGNLRKRDLQTDGPYNTYTRIGLPPTPIALPGAAALQAAANPQRTGALFFVATGKGDGSHHFSKTNTEHNAAVRRYLSALRANK